MHSDHRKLEPRREVRVIDTAVLAPQLWRTERRHLLCREIFIFRREVASEILRLREPLPARGEEREVPRELRRELRASQLSSLIRAP